MTVDAKGNISLAVHMLSQTPKTREVFLVDDEPAFTDLMADLLARGIGIPVRVFNRPRAALHALEHGGANPSFLISDLLMPEMNGFDFLREVERLRPELPCLLVTGNAEDSTLARGDRLPNLIAVLFKPVSWRDIASLIREHGTSTSVSLSET